MERTRPRPSRRSQRRPSDTVVATVSASDGGAGGLGPPVSDEPPPLVPVVPEDPSKPPLLVPPDPPELELPVPLASLLPHAGSTSAITAFTPKRVILPMCSTYETLTREATTHAVR